MPDNIAMSFRKSRAAVSRDPAPRPARTGLSTIGLGLAAGTIGFGAMAWFNPALLNGVVPERFTGWITGRAAARTPAHGPSGPRVIAPVPGVRETGNSTTGMAATSPQALVQAYVPTGPVVLRTPDSYVEIEGPRLLPPPIGRTRTQSAVLDHASRLGNDLRSLAYTPCDKHLRHLAAANITLFIAGFHTPRTQVSTGAPPNLAFWSQPEANAVRRIARELASKGALAPADFGLDTSPEVKGLFENVPLGQITCG